MNEKLDLISRQNAILSYNDLRPGGRLADYVQDFIYFNNFEICDEFLNVVNFADHSDESWELGGLCERLDRYSKWNQQRRKEHNENLQLQKQVGVSTLSGDEYSDSDGEESESDDDMLFIPIVSPRPKRRGPKRKLHWKTEFLIYCFYAKCNISMKRTAAFFGIGKTLVHDILFMVGPISCVILLQSSFLSRRAARC